MFHDGERLALGLEATENGIIVHAGFDEFEGDFSVHGSGLFGEPDLAHASFAEFSEQLIGADSFWSREILR
jgi:hypothetical protein